MKQNISSLELKYLINEIKIVVGGRLDKIYQPNPKELFLSFHIASEGKIYVKIWAGHLIYITNNKPEMPEMSGFCSFLRNHLENSRVKISSRLEQNE